MWVGGGGRAVTRFVTEFEKLNRVGEGTYGIVYRARDTKSNEVGGGVGVHIWRV